MQQASFSRALSTLLLVLIVYGTAVEAAHRHGRILSSDESTSSTSITSPADSGSMQGGQVGCSDCLICQLHQNFSSALITFRQHSPTPSLRAQFSDSISKSFHSQTNAPTSDRAPPQAN